MITDSPFTRGRVTSHAGPHHATRSDVWRYWLERALKETSFALDDFVEGVANHYSTHTPQHARRLRFKPLTTDLPVKDYAARLTRMRKTLQRYIATDSLHPPQDLEESIIDGGLPEPYRTHCRLDLVRRLGCAGVPLQPGQPSPAEDLRLVAETISDSGDVVARFSQMLADGQLGPEDRAVAVDAVRAIGKTIADLHALQLRVEQAVFGDDAKTEVVTALHAKKA